MRRSTGPASGVAGSSKLESPGSVSMRSVFVHGVVHVQAAAVAQRRFGMRLVTRARAIRSRRAQIPEKGTGRAWLGHGCFLVCVPRCGG